MSLGKLARIHAFEEYSRSLDSTLSEFEAELRIKQRRGMFSGNSSAGGPAGAGAGGGGGTGAGGMLGAKVPYTLDFISTYYHLCAVLVLAYQKLLASSTTEFNMTQTLKLDARVS